MHRRAIQTVMRLVLASVVLGSLGLFLSSPAGAQESGGEAVVGQLDYEDSDGTDVPLEGVTITVTDSTGAEVGAAASDAEGAFEIEVPGPGVYTVTLDTSTLPAGVSLADLDAVSRTVQVNPGAQNRALFRIVEGDIGEADGAGKHDISFRQVVQRALDGLKLGIYLGLAAIGLSLIYGTTGLTNFAHGEMVTIGALSAYFFNYYGLAGAIGFIGGPGPFGDGVHIVFAASLALIISAAVGWLFDAGIFGPLRRRGTGLFAQMVVTIGLSIMVRYVLQYLVGGRSKFYRGSTQDAWKIGPAQLAPKDVVMMGLSVAVLVGVAVYLQRTRMGRAMRAVADNKDLAASSGIDVEQVIRYVWVGGAVLAGLGGIFIGMSDQVSWDMGTSILLLLFAGVTLGGLGTAYGPLVGSVIVGLGIQVSTIGNYLPDDLKNLGALVAMVAILMFRPQGILGRSERIG